MTTTGAVTVAHISRNSPGISLLRARGVVCLASVAFLGASLAGCGSSNLLGSSTTDVGSVQSATQVAPSQPETSSVSQSRIGVAAVMGAPDAVSKQVGTQLGGALEKQRVKVAQASDKPDYTLRGYMVATRERAATKISYIFDLTDPNGKRVNRIQGEEMAQGGDARDPWSAVTPELAQRISDKTAASLATALASLTPGSSAGATPPVGVGAAPPAGNVQTAKAAAPSGATTGSIDRGAATSGPTAIIPAVTGAPGDGNAALSGAMRQELQQSGIGSANPGQRAYQVVGKVTMGPVKDGKQPIKIDWRVSDPAGALLATVSQNNEIQAGSLDGQWGNIATDAAQGAASRIKQLIDENQAATSRAGAQTAARSRG